MAIMAEAVPGSKYLEVMTYKLYAAAKAAAVPRPTIKPAQLATEKITWAGEREDSPL